MLEEQLVDLVVMAMERSENDDASNDECLSQLLWQHLSSQVIYFVLFQFASFPHMVVSLYEKVNKSFLNRFKSDDSLYNNILCTCNDLIKYSKFLQLKGRNLNKGRDHLMWVLLQFISGSIQKNPVSQLT